MSAEPEQKADIKFLFDSGNDTITAIQAHQSVLSAGSDVFKSMFDEMPKNRGEFNVKGVPKMLFKEFLKFFYQDDRVNLSAKNAYDLLNMGLKYKVQKCIDDCTRFLIKILSVGNVCNTLEFAIHFNQTDLIKKCEEFIIVNTEAVLRCRNFFSCTKDVLEHILRMNMLSWSEFHIFEACMAWVKHQSKETKLTKELVDKHLGDLFYEIRFRSITYRELCSLVNRYRDVLEEDFTTISDMITRPRFQADKFNVCPRQFRWNEEAVIKCDRVLNNGFERNFDFDDIEETSFLTNRPLVLGRFKCCEISSANLRVTVKINEVQLYAGARAKDLLEMTTLLQSNGTISLIYPVLIRPGFLYTISIEKCASAQVFYSNELETKIILETEFSIEFHNYSTCQETGKTIGLISALDFNRL